MGNKQSGISRQDKKFKKDIKKTQTQSKNISWFIDNIATKFILTADFQKLLQLQDKSTCDQFTVLTKELIQKKLTPREILYLDYRTKNGDLVKILDRNDFAIIDNNDLDNLDLNNAVKKNRICIGIAEFYVQFFHLFASIVKVINPVYRYRDSNGNVMELDLLEKMNIPKGKEKRKVLLNMCSERLKSLSPVQQTDNGTIVMGKFCQNESTSICNEPGLQELKNLYFDEYDYDPESNTAGKYYRMSDSMKQQYEKDVSSFYKAFTGETQTPENIKDFCDINTLDVSKLITCNDENLYNTYKGTGKEPTLRNYGLHLREMMKNTKENQEKLIQILDQMFHYEVDPIKKTKQLGINPKLKKDDLKELVDTTRKIIIKIFIDCENNYKKGIQLYRAITLDKTLVVEKRRIRRHNEIKEQLITQNDDMIKNDTVIKTELPNTLQDENSYEIKENFSENKARLNEQNTNLQDVRMI